MSCQPIVQLRRDAAGARQATTRSFRRVSAHANMPAVGSKGSASPSGTRTHARQKNHGPRRPPAVTVSPSGSKLHGSQNLSQDRRPARARWPPSGGLAAPAIAQGAAKVLKFVPQANLANFDPIWGTQYVVRNASQLVWDTLYGINSKLEPKRADGRERGGLGRRPDLDLQAARRPQVPRRRAGARQGLRRLASRAGPTATPWARCCKAIQKELVAVDDRTFKWVLSQALPEDALCARQGRHAVLLHHAGADRQDRSLQADRGVSSARAR